MWGLSNLVGKDRVLLLKSNQQLRQAIRFIKLSHGAGGRGYLENPRNSWLWDVVFFLAAARIGWGRFVVDTDFLSI